MKTLLNRFAVAFFKLLPLRLSRHLMFLLGQNPSITDRWGYHIRGIHYYDPLPNFQELTSEQTTQRRVSPAIHFDLPRQVSLLQHLGHGYSKELAALGAAAEPEGFNFHNDYFAGLDASVYYALIRDLKPARVVEIGSGNSTRIADKALRRNRGEARSGELICVEPYPQPRLTEAKLEARLIQERVEKVDPDLFASLKANDILFIDSSHAVKFGGDVCYEFLEILPRLQSGVWVHVHDIFFPHDYPAEWLIEKRIAFNEQYLLEAFLAFNTEFSVRLTNYWLALDHSHAVDALCPRSLRPSGHLGLGSFWMQKRL